MWDRGEGKEKNQVKQPREQKHEKEQVVIMVGLCREEQPRPLGCRIQDRGQGMSARKVPQVGTEEWRQNQGARKTLQY